MKCLLLLTCLTISMCFADPNYPDNQYHDIHAGEAYNYQFPLSNGIVTNGGVQCSVYNVGLKFNMVRIYWSPIPGTVNQWNSHTLFLPANYRYENIYFYGSDEVNNNNVVDVGFSNLDPLNSNDLITLKCKYINTQ